MFISEMNVWSDTSDSIAFCKLVLRIAPIWPNNFFFKYFPEFLYLKILSKAVVFEYFSNFSVLMCFIFLPIGPTFYSNPRYLKAMK